MVERSRVRRELKSCMVCSKRYRTGAVVIFKGTPPDGYAGWGLCPLHQRMRERNLIALVEVDPTKSDVPEIGENMLPEKAVRTGRVAYLTPNAFRQIFTGPPPDTMVAFVPPEVVEVLQKIKEGTQHH